MPACVHFNRLWLAGCLALALACDGDLHAAEEAPASVLINGETKLLEGILRLAVAGDIACHLELESTAGVTFNESAAFEICEDQSLVGKRMRLSYTVENVLSEACQGDLDCGQSDQLVLVSAVRVLSDAELAQDAERSPCDEGETVVFACHSGSKRVSVCASHDASVDAGYVQYRFGSPDGSAPELVLPAGRLLPAQAVRGENQPFAGGGGSWLRFRNGNFAYVVYSGIGRWGTNGETEERQGVVVERGGEMVANRPCTGPLEGELGPDWLEQVGIGAAGEEFDFPE